MMQQLNILLYNPILFTVLVGVVGLLVGSFLNVVIYRLPVMMQRGWQSDCRDFMTEPLQNAYEKLSAQKPLLAIQPTLVDLNKESWQQLVPLFLALPEQDQPKTFNLSVPLSRCPHCHAAIKPYQNIPLLSYIFLRARCAECKHKISLRYPVIEAFTAMLSMLVAWHFGFSMQAGFALLLTWALIALSFIDIDQQLLPDSITLPLLWLGLLLSLFQVYCDAHASIIGAVAGYLSLWSVYQVFKLTTGKEGMGFGDFKLLALFGAWLGWHYLPVIILLSSLVGAVIGIAMIVFANKDRSVPIPFGPYLAAAGWIALLWGHDLNQIYLSATGL